MERERELEQKNKKLGWLILQERCENGKPLPEQNISGKRTGNIFALFEGDFSDEL